MEAGREAAGIIARAEKTTLRGNPEWRKGVSGNPGGRPKGVEARVRAVMDLEECIGILASIARAPNAAHRDRIAAAKLIMERGYGCPRQVVVVEQESPDEFKPEQLTRAERDAMEALLEKARAVTPSTPKIH